jgi:endonuclease-3
VSGSKDRERQRIADIMGRLDETYPDASCSLEFTDPLQLLISTQLSAQCTDERVNIVTQDLYRKYRTVDDFADADQAELERDIYSTGFYRNKARNIIACCRTLREEYGGRIPDTLEEMLQLPGVGRKTANLVLFTVYGVPGLVIDTHAKRLAYRMGLTRETEPEKVERDLMRKIPKERWGAFSHQLVHHGRAFCDARKPNCGDCPISPFCPKVLV